MAVASLNMLNRYVKQDGSRIGYQFRIHIINVLKGIEDISEKKSILSGYVLARNNLLLFRFWDFQFSFHGEKLTNQVQSLISKKPIDWDGIKKQPCSKSILEFALSNQWISNKTMKEENLLELVRNKQNGSNK